jgi:transmembrane sensor
MQSKFEEIRSLVIWEIQGKLSEEKQMELLTLVQQDTELAQYRQELWHTLGTPSLNEHFVKYDDAAFSDDIIGRIQRQKEKTKHTKKAILIGGLTSAAAAIIVAVCITPSIFKPNSRSTEVVSSMTGNLAGVQLKFENGSAVTLDKDTTQIVSGAFSISSSGKSASLKDLPGGATHEQFATITVPAGKDYTIRLSDGTVVQLNCESSLRFPTAFSNGKREIFVDGEAYIKVAPNAVMPFTVHLSNGKVEVLGTEFNVNNYNKERAVVSLISGKVKVANDANNLVLSPGLSGIISPKALSQGTFDEYEVLSWRTGVVIYNDAKLDSVFSDFPRLFGIPLIIDNKQSRDNRFNGGIDRSQSMEVQLKAMQSIGYVTYYKDDKNIFHVRYK